MAAHFLTPLFDGPGPWGFRIQRTGAWLAEYIEPAFDSATRNRGLLGRDHFPEGHALVIAPSQAVHTFGMRFPIDIVGVTRDGRVVRCRAGVPARRLALALRAWAIVELPAGTIERRGLREQDRLSVEPREQGTAPDSTKSPKDENLSGSRQTSSVD